METPCLIGYSRWSSQLYQRYQRPPKKTFQPSSHYPPTRKHTVIQKHTSKSEKYTHCKSGYLCFGVLYTCYTVSLKLRKITWCHVIFWYREILNPVQYIMRYYEPGFNLSLRNVEPPYEILNPGFNI